MCVPIPSQPEIDTFSLVNAACCKLDNKVAIDGVTSLSENERIVYFVWNALGILENGSFQYFFENDMDPNATAQAFQQLGFLDSAECFRLAKSLLPSEYIRADWDRRLELLQYSEEPLDILAQKVLRDRNEAEVKLAAYIAAKPNLER